MENITLGQLQTTIIFLATFLTSGGIILAFALKVIKSIIHNQITPLCNSMKQDIKQIQEDNKALHEELKRNSLNTMKNTICNEAIPLTERISVGREYIEDGGNGAIKILVHTLEDKYEQQINLKEQKGDY